ncbi:guanine-N(7)-methyltransferase [Cystobasidium minutum MCA 4210]|uniref:guanine-N(7)-methyltransferase n=1 Tax=Cystobasidium minutum MCA 4210 TaxID=1397322 RepID=UPI0034CE66F5|eukprot:jgi/Rhomi1/146422/e_gw1.6.559.1
MKGKGRAAPPVAPPEDVEITPQYVEPPPLPPALQPGPIVRRRPSITRNGSSGQSSPKKRKRESFALAPVTGEGSQVAEHYNKRLNFSREERNYSPIIGLKSFNNWIKSVLIAKYARDYHRSQEEQQQDRNGHRGGPRRPQSRFRVLDMGCGKGGDLQKWQKAGITDYVAVDIAEVSIQQARRRWEELRGRRFNANFYALDCYSNPLTAIIPDEILRDPPFDVVTMQFCMHYAFQSVSKARMMLENVSRYLKKGGTFIGTIPDSEQLLTRLKELPPDANPLAFGNEVYRIVFDDRSKFPAFGHRYTFYLTDAVEDVPEYVVQWQAFEELAAEYSLKLLYHGTFHELFSAERETPEFEQLLVRMKVVSPDGESELTEDQWEAANIYVAFAFIKV